MVVVVVVVIIRLPLVNHQVSIIMTTTSTYDDTQHAMMKCVDNEDSTSALHSNGKTVKLRLIFVNHDGKALEEEFSVMLIII